jgi:hypothetical protein
VNVSESQRRRGVIGAPSPYRRIFALGDAAGKQTRPPATNAAGPERLFVTRMNGQDCGGGRGK